MKNILCIDNYVIIIGAGHCSKIDIEASAFVSPPDILPMLYAAFLDGHAGAFCCSTYNTCDGRVFYAGQKGTAGLQDEPQDN